MAGYASNSIWGDAPAASDSIAMTNSGTQDNSHHMYSTGYSTQPAFAAPQGRSAREIELDTREAELRLREAKLAIRERDAGDYHPPNWPPIRPMVYHDIENDIPKSGQWIVKRLFTAWYLATLCFFLNFIAAFSLLITKAEVAGATFGISLLIMCIGIPMSFVFWYRSIYFGVKHDRSINFMFFFFNYGVHLIAMVVLCVGIPGWGGAGYIYMFSQFSSNLGSAICCLISSAMMSFQVLFGIWQMKSAHSYFRSKGLTTDQARDQAVQGVANSKVGQDIGKEIGKQAIKQAVVGAK